MAVDHWKTKKGANIVVGVKVQPRSSHFTQSVAAIHFTVPHMCTHTHTHTYAHVHARTHVHTLVPHTHTHTHTHASTTPENTDSDYHTWKATAGVAVAMLQ